MPAFKIAVTGLYYVRPSVVGTVRQGNIRFEWNRKDGAFRSGIGAYQLQGIRLNRIGAFQHRPGRDAASAAKEYAPGGLFQRIYDLLVAEIRNHGIAARSFGPGLWSGSLQKKKKLRLKESSNENDF